MDKPIFYSYRKPLEEILKCLIAFGYSSEYTKNTLVPNLINSINTMKNPIPCMSYFAILGLDNEIEIFDTCFKALKNIAPEDLNKRIAFLEKDVGFLYLYLKYNYPEKNYAQSLEESVSKEKLEKSMKFVNNSEKEQLFCNNLVKKI